MQYCDALFTKYTYTLSESTQKKVPKQKQTLDRIETYLPNAKVFMFYLVTGHDFNTLAVDDQPTPLTDSIFYKNYLQHRQLFETSTIKFQREETGYYIYLEGEQIVQFGPYTSELHAPSLQFIFFGLSDFITGYIRWVNSNWGNPAVRDQLVKSFDNPIFEPLVFLSFLARDLKEDFKTIFQRLLFAGKVIPASFFVTLARRKLDIDPTLNDSLYSLPIFVRKQKRDQAPKSDASDATTSTSGQTQRPIGAKKGKSQTSDDHHNLVTVEFIPSVFTRVPDLAGLLSVANLFLYCKNSDIVYPRGLTNVIALEDNLVDFDNDEN